MENRIAGLFFPIQEDRERRRKNMETLIQGSMRTVTDRHTKRRVCADKARAREEARRNEYTRSVIRFRKCRSDFGCCF